MKKKITLFCGILFCLNMYSQAPQKMSYQSVIRDASNALVSNTSVGIRISILQGSVSGASQYVEVQTVNTNINGLATLAIGNGSTISGSMSSIGWANGPFFIKTETDPTGGTNYSITGTSELMSVPYALYAANSPQGIQGIPGTNGTNGDQGPMGMQGDIGPQGLQGDQGPMGMQGEIGPQGIQGDQGPMGMQGDIGPQGLQGDQGPMGMQGEIGPQGIQGDQGPMGMQGDIGPQGLQGDQGPMGMQGEIGPQGIQGDQGPMGMQGDIGPQGLQGDPGPMGMQGDIGMMGAPGIDGSNASISLAAISTISTTNGATINNGELSLSPADEYNGGVVSTQPQNFAGDKTFKSNVNVDGNVTANASISPTIVNNLTINASNANTYKGQVIICNPNYPIAITIENGSSLPIGYNFMVLQQSEDANKISITAGNNSIIKNRYDYTATSGKYAVITIIHIGNGVFVTAGDMQ